MLVLTTQAAVFAANCYVIAPHAGGPCLVLDPGAGVLAGVARAVREHDLEPVVVAATHGHPDHVWDAAAVSEEWDIPFFLQAADLDRLEDPVAALGPGLAEGFQSLVGAPWRAPAEARALPGELDLGGLHLGLVPAPGHTPGSTVVVVEGSASAASTLPATVTGRPLAAASALAFTGDVLFAGSIGRVDLPGGDMRAMTTTLSRLVAAIPPTAWVLAGHGPISTMALERAHNPYLGPGRFARGAF